MYSQRVTDLTLDFHANKYGWRPEAHSIREVRSFIAEVDSLLDVEANQQNRYYSFKPGARLTKAYIAYLRRFIENEQFMCFASAEYFLTRYAHILGVGEEILQFEFRIAQRIFHSILAEFDDLQVAIELFILKARQVGISTVTALYFLHRLLFRSNVKAVMASVKHDQSEKIGKMLDTCWQRLPFWLPPAKTVLKTSSPEWANGSILSIQSGSQQVGIAQGWTPSCIHISELGDYTTPKKTLEEGLFRAAHSHRHLFFAMEGTGNASSQWQTEKWKYYKENWGKGGRFRPIFIPPACAPDLYPLPDWLKKNPIPEGWTPRLEETKRMQRKAELFVRSTEYLSRFLGTNWTMGREYLWFWEVHFREAISSHTEKVWLSQMACTDDEALIGKHDTVFNDEVIEVVTKEREREYLAYAVTGKTILIGSENKPYEPPPETIDTELPRIQLHWEAPDGNTYDWELVPLLPFNDGEDQECFNKLLIFIPPNPGSIYSMGVDTADGLGTPNEDRSCLSVLVNRTGKQRDEQAAEFVSNRVNSPQMARIAAAVAVLYGEESGDPMGVKMAIEQRRKPGDECQHQLKIMGFHHHHRMVMYDQKGLPDPSRATKEGFFTNVWSRPMMLNKYVDSVNTGWLKINSPMLLRQMKKFVRIEKDGVSRMDHEVGNHDDNIFSSAMAYFTRHDMDNSALRQEQRYQSDEEKQAKPDMGWCTQGVTLDGYHENSSIFRANRSYIGR